MTRSTIMLGSAFILFVQLNTLTAQTHPADNFEWPVLKHYDQDHTNKIALPIGGIGTGTVSLMGNGALRNWEIMNRPAKGFHAAPRGNRTPFFAIYTKTNNSPALTRGLMGPIDYAYYESKEGRGANNHGIPRFSKCTFDAAYPFGQVHLSDDKMPVNVTVKGFNPMIPGRADDSGIPIAILKYVIQNKTDSPLTVSVCGSFENFIGADGSKYTRDWKGDMIPSGAKNNRNEFRRQEDFAGIFMNSQGVDSTAEQWGTIALTTLAGPDITYRTIMAPGSWGNDILDLWDDFSADGRLTEKSYPQGNSPRAALSARINLAPHQSQTLTFFITWHFPNRRAWASETIGNYYTTQYDDAWDVITKTLPHLPQLEAKTVQWVKTFIDSDLPTVVKEAALFNTSTLRTQTCFRTPDGRFYGWEGSMDMNGSCQGSCTHVWNYEQATAFLYGDLALKMREVEFNHATHDNGLMSFRVSLPLKNAQRSSLAAADGQMGTIMKIYRDWQLSGNDQMLKQLWPNVKKALSFCWIEGGWDSNADGVMEGCQHNTMDVEYYGPNPQMQLWYLGALRAAEEMAQYLDEPDFASHCRSLFQNGSTWTDANLFNSEYYEHIVTPPKSHSDVASGLTVGMDAGDLQNPAYQLARGCLVDQLVGQYFAHIAGLGYLVKPENVQTTLNSIMKYNYKTSMSDHFNNMRSYALGDESALLMAAYPYERPTNPFPYFNEVMTGFEYTAAIGMLYEGQTENGLKCIQNIRNRYDGLKRSPFDEAECGHHYARAMASWASTLALTGFHYSAVDQSIAFHPNNGTNFFSNGYAWGSVTISGDNNKKTAHLNVMQGPLNLITFTLNNFGSTTLPQSQTLNSGQKITLTITANQ
ncbi:GH116 family glycosyl-hydrolase [Planctomycetota bacterium]